MILNCCVLVTSGVCVCVCVNRTDQLACVNMFVSLGPDRGESFTNGCWVVASSDFVTLL